MKIKSALKKKSGNILLQVEVTPEEHENIIQDGVPFDLTGFLSYIFTDVNGEEINRLVHEYKEKPIRGAGLSKLGMETSLKKFIKISGLE